MASDVEALCGSPSFRKAKKTAKCWAKKHQKDCRVYEDEEGYYTIVREVDFDDEDEDDEELIFEAFGDGTHEYYF